MYIIACKAHFCHLFGHGQVGNSPRETSGSAGTIDWGPMWLGSQSTCHPQCPYTPTGSLMPLHSLPALWHPWCHYTPTSPRGPIHLCWSLSPYTPCQPHMYCWHPLPAPDVPNSPYTLYWLPNAPWCPTPLLAPQPLHSLPAPMHPWHPCQPKMPPYPLHPYWLQCPWCHYTPAFPWALYSLPAHQCTLDTPTPPVSPLTPLHPC